MQQICRTGNLPSVADPNRNTTTYTARKSTLQQWSALYPLNTPHCMQREVHINIYPRRSSHCWTKAKDIKYNEMQLVQFHRCSVLSSVFSSALNLVEDGALLNRNTVVERIHSVLEQESWTLSLQHSSLRTVTPQLHEHSKIHTTRPQTKRHWLLSPVLIKAELPLTLPDRAALLFLSN